MTEANDGAESPPLSEQSLGTFLDGCAARTPTPGGGAGCAVVAAIGAAFGAMAARYTEGRKGSEPHARAVAAGIAALDIARTALLDLAQRDVHAYAGFDRARRLKKSTSDEARIRTHAMQKAARESANVPLAAIRITADALDAISAISPHLNPHLASDTGVSAILLKAALRGLLLNVEVNLTSLPADEADRLRKEANEIVSRGEWAAQSTLADAKAAMRGEIL